MSLSTRTISKFIIIIWTTIFIACSSIIPKNSVHMSPLSTQNDTFPKSCVILPFTNKTTETGIEIFVRKSFYNHFSSKNFRDLELNGIDRILEIHDQKSPKPWRELPVQDIGKLFHVDYLIFGRVMEFKKIFLGIYSQLALKIEIDMIDAKTGKMVLSKSILKRSHDGGLPFNPLSIIPATLRSGKLMQKDKTIDLIDKTNRELVDTIPEPAGPPATPHFIEIQVASFLEDEYARNTLLEFEGKGLNPRIETVILENRKWHRVLLGPYFNMPEAEKIKEIVVKNTKYQPVFIHHY